MVGTNLKFVWAMNTPVVEHCLPNPSLVVRVNTQNTRERNCHRCCVALGASSNHVVRSVHIGTRTIFDLSPRHNGTGGHFIKRITITEFIVVGCGVVLISVVGGGVINGSVFDGGVSDGGVFGGNAFDRSVFTADSDLSSVESWTAGLSVSGT
jgi:hypothetical protein